MAATPIAITGGGGCGDCDLCCVLNSGAYGACTKLWWQCICPDGTLVMQQNDGGGWYDISGWAEDGPNYWYPFSTNYNPLGNLTASFRLKCTRESLVFYSNSIVANLSPDCKCSNSSTVNNLFGRIDYSIDSWTQASWAATPSYGTAVDYVLGLTCSSTDTSSQFHSVLLDGAPGNYILGKFQVQTTQFRCSVEGYTSAGTLVFNPAKTRSRSTLTKGYRCYRSCFGLNAGSLLPQSFLMPTSAAYDTGYTPPRLYYPTGDRVTITGLDIDYTPE